MEQKGTHLMTPPRLQARIHFNETVLLYLRKWRVEHSNQSIAKKCYKHKKKINPKPILNILQDSEPQSQAFLSIPCAEMHGKGSMYTHTHTHSYTHTQSHTSTHCYTHTQSHAHAHTYTQSHTHTHLYTHSYSHTQSHTHTYTQSHTLKHIVTHSHLCTLSHMYTHTH